MCTSSFFMFCSRLASSHGLSFLSTFVFDGMTLRKNQMRRNWSLQSARCQRFGREDCRLIQILTNPARLPNTAPTMTPALGLPPAVGCALLEPVETPVEPVAPVLGIVASPVGPTVVVDPPLVPLPPVNFHVETGSGYESRITHMKPTAPCGPYTVQLSMINPVFPPLDPSCAVMVNVCDLDVSRLEVKNNTTLWETTSFQESRVALVAPSKSMINDPVSGPVTPSTTIDPPIKVTEAEAPLVEVLLSVDW